ncbi:RWD domain-containing protein [Ophiocordyceps camponoti-floridani]|uniref:RWD domain-containing protein n=1 Tax=Ophiocordyceps camponoti-floridani TaxID=2030778 RepID=A0A8H4Q429_9HYPO|nr:RWD domain-containing protein [Ophiocordyceps camponoti-floridani]
MTDELADEVEAINSIYGPETLAPDPDSDAATTRDGPGSGPDGSKRYILTLPGAGASKLRLRFPASYPFGAEAPTVVACVSVDHGIDHLDDGWILSDPITERKSTFLAQAHQAKTPTEAQSLISALLSHRPQSSATHNITAYRVRTATALYQDSDDDGEAAAGRRLLRLLQLCGACDVVVVVSRWFGGVKLGPRRFALVNSVARGALVRGGWVG